jgi:hypothetical protein
MSSETPAAHLARLKTEFPAWKLWHGDVTGHYWAAPPPGHKDQTLVSAPDVTLLEQRIREIEAWGAGQ